MPDAERRLTVEGYPDIELVIISPDAELPDAVADWLLELAAEVLRQEAAEAAEAASETSAGKLPEAAKATTTATNSPRSGRRCR